MDDFFFCLVVFGNQLFDIFDQARVNFMEQQAIACNTNRKLDEQFNVYVCVQYPSDVPYQTADNDTYSQGRNDGLPQDVP